MRQEKTCSTCGEEIAASARKCIHCDSYQDWRRFFGFSSPVLALLVALVSVATFAVPVFRDVLAPKDSHLTGSFHGFVDDEPVFVVSNSGNRAGTVGVASIWLVTVDSAGDSVRIRADGTEIISGLPLAPKYHDESFFVDAGESKLIQYQSQLAAEDFQGRWEKVDPSDLRCAIGVNLINFSGKRSHPCFETDCNRLLSAVFRTQLKTTNVPGKPGKPIMVGVCRTDVDDR